MESLERFNIELKRAEEYLDAMAKGTANKEDCENVKMHLDNINSIVRSLSIPDVIVPKGTLCDDCKEAKEDTITLCKECYLND